MTKSMLLAIAEAAGLDAPLSSKAVSDFVARPLAQAPAPSIVPAAISLEDKIKRDWDADPKLRAQFANQFGSYRALQIHEAAKASGLRPDVFKAQQLDLPDHLAKLETRSGPLSSAERTAIEGYAATWRASGDIRLEFRTFAVYAAYMRAKASGQCK